MSVSAFVLITLHDISVIPQDTKQIPSNLKSISEIDSVYIVGPSSTSYNLIIKVTTSSLNSLYKLVRGTISKVPEVKETTTMIIVNS